MKKIILFILMLPLFGMSRSPKVLTRDIVYLKNGEEINGSVTNIDDEFVEILTSHGKVMIPVGKVLSIESSRRRPGDTWEKISDIKDTLLLKALKVPVDSLFPRAGYVNIFVIKRFKLNPDSSFEYTERRIIKILKERGKRAANQLFKYHKSYENGEIVFARTVTRDGRVVSIMDNAIEDASVYSSFPEYDDLHQVKFAIPEGEPGNVLDFEIKITGRRDIHHPAYRRITMGDNDPTYKEYVEIEGPDNLLWYNVENFDGIKKETVKNNKKYITFLIHNHPGYIVEPDMPPVHYILPTITCGLKSTKSTVLFQNYVKNILKDFNPENLLDSLVSKSMTFADSVFAIYRFVAQDIKRVPVDGESFSIFPKSPAHIIKKSAGSEVDKAFLLYALLKKFGLAPNLILTVSKNTWDFNENANISQFTGLIVKLDTVYLDPANDRIPFGYVRPSYQGVKGISLNGKVTKIPFISPEREGEIDLMNMSLTSSGDLVIEDNALYRGEDGTGIRTLKQYRKVELEKLLEQSITWAPGIVLDSFRLSDLNDLRIPPKLSVYYHIPEYAIVADNLILLKMPDLSDYTAEDVGATVRFNPLYFPRNYRSIKDIIINLPPGYKVRYLPKNYRGEVKFLKFNSIIFESSGKVHYSDETIRHGGIYDKKYYPGYRKIIEHRAKLRDNWIVIEKMKY